MPTRILAVLNQKGGVGKTTTTANLGAACARLGRRTLVCDLDPQANLTAHLAVDPRRAGRSVYDVLRGGCGIGDALAPTGVAGLTLLPAHLDLAGAEVELAGTVGRELILRDALAAWLATTGEAAPELILIDCPPSLGLCALNALVAAQEVLLPLQPEFFALQGLAKLLEVIALVRRRLNPRLELLGVVACLVDPRTSLAAETLAEVERHLPGKLLKARIRRNVRLAEAPSHGQDIFTYAPSSNGAADYRALAREILGVPAEVPPLSATKA